jgi:hypothetical protein
MLLHLKGTAGRRGSTLTPSLHFSDFVKFDDRSGRYRSPGGDCAAINLLVDRGVRGWTRGFPMLGRFVAAIGGLFLALAGWAWLRAETALERGVSGASFADGYYAVDVAGAETTIDLPAGLDEPCGLIVSSLGDSDRTFRIRIAETRAVCPPSRLREVAAVRWPGAQRAFVPTKREVALPHSELETSTDSQNGSTVERRFHLHVTDTPLEDTRGYTQVKALLAAEGHFVRVFRDVQIKPGEIAPGLIEEIIHLLDERIIPRSRDFLGAHVDVDGDGKLAVLLTPWLGRLQGGRTSVNGFVRNSDFQPEGSAPFSNRADVLYLNSALRSGSDLTALLAHEYTHAVCCSLRRGDRNRPNGLPAEADWLNEAIAHVAERLHEAGWSNLDRRVQSYLEKPHETPLVVRDYYRSGLWRDPSCRGATYLFLQWCLDGYGPELLHALATEPQIGTEKLERVTGHPFAALFRHWTMALDAGSLPSLDLNSQLGACRLVGPHRHAWRPAEGPLELSLRGTAAAFVCPVADGSTSSGGRIVITAPAAARLQVTLRALPVRQPTSRSRLISGRPFLFR